MSYRLLGHPFQSSVLRGGDSACCLSEVHLPFPAECACLAWVSPLLPHCLDGCQLRQYPQRPGQPNALAGATLGMLRFVSRPLLAAFTDQKKNQKDPWLFLLPPTHLLTERGQVEASPCPSQPNPCAYLGKALREDCFKGRGILSACPGKF